MGQKIYIEFDDPNSSSNSEPNKFLKVIIKILSVIISKANPDFENLLKDVTHWKVEYDLTMNATWREIGFDKNGVSIVAMPFGNNYGFWVDNQLTLKDYERFRSNKITAKEFTKDWVDFENKSTS